MTSSEGPDDGIRRTTRPAALPRVIAVTGSSGRLGRALVERLAREPGVERVVALDLAAPHARHAAIELRRCDVRDAGFARYLEGCGALVHLAFVSEGKRRTGRGADAQVVRANVEALRNVMSAAAAAGVRHVVYASSIAVYGFHPDNRGRTFVEDDPLRESDFVHGRVKVACERVLDELERAHPSVTVARLRPSIFSGPHSDGRLRLLRQPFFPCLAGDDTPMHVTHEEDVAEAFHLALARGARGAFNVAADEPLSLRECARHLGAIAVTVPDRALGLATWAHARQLIDEDPSWARVGRGAPIVVSSAKARRTLRWRPRHESTGAALRAIAGRPGAAASRGTRLLLGLLGALTRMRGELPATPRQHHELRAVRGKANLAITGPHPSEWHLGFREGAVGVYPGLARDARATASMTEAVLFELLTGERSWASAVMTGRVRISGDADYGLIIGGVIAAVGQLFAAPSLPARALARLVRVAGYDEELGS